MAAAGCLGLVFESGGELYGYWGVLGLSFGLNWKLWWWVACWFSVGLLDVALFGLFQRKRW